MSLRMIRKTNVRNRAAYDPSMPKMRAPAIITNITSTAADAIEVTFSMPVITAKLPGWTAGAAGDETVSAMSLVSETVVAFTFTGDVQGTNMTVEEGDPGIRTMAGGFVPAGSYPVPTFP